MCAERIKRARIDIRRRRRPFSDPYSGLTSGSLTARLPALAESHRVRGQQHHGRRYWVPWLLRGPVRGCRPRVPDHADVGRPCCAICVEMSPAIATFYRPRQFSFLHQRVNRHLRRAGLVAVAGNLSQWKKIDGGRISAPLPVR